LGTYPVKFYKSGGRVALAMVLFLLEKITSIDHWELAKYTDGSAGYSVDMATGCFADYEANVLTSKTDSYEKIESIFEMPFTQMKVGNKGENIIGFSTGMGDGTYSSYWGLSMDNKAVCLVTDFNMIKA
jgi:hypothetical protein